MALACVAAAFAFVQGLDVVAQRFGWPNRIEQVIILALAIGFFDALVLAGYHGERGVQRVGGAELLIIALLLVIGGGALWAYARGPRVAVTPALAVTPKPLVPQATAAIVSVPSPTSVPGKSVAVLPFANESDATAQFGWGHILLPVAGSCPDQSRSRHQQSAFRLADPALPRRPALRRVLQDGRPAHHHRRGGEEVNPVSRRERRPQAERVELG